MITSTSNSHIKSIRKLRERKERVETGLFYAEGLRLVGEAIQLDWDIEELLFSQDLLISEFGKELVQQANGRDIRIVELSPEVFRYLSNKDGPQGIAIIARQRAYDLDFISEKQGLWVGLEGIQDAGNLGTIIRTADGAGAQGILLLNNCIDPFDPAVVRASMGAIFSQKVVLTTTVSFVPWANNYQGLIIGTSDKANTYYRDMQYTKSMILLMGSEQKGLSEELHKICKMVSIPMVGRSDSLNISIATGVLLYEIYDQAHKNSLEGMD